MKEVVNDSVLLNQKIKESKEYRKYLDTKKALYEYPELSEKLKEFRRINYDLQNQQGVNNYDAVTELVKQYDELLHNSIVSDFLRAEQRICKLMQKVFNSITDGLEFDYLDE